ncbi:MAG: hypothetical protein JWR59_1307 [Brevundimonas sp.]|nr:hypothetical protein [Brevundimonas sp.]
MAQVLPERAPQAARGRKVAISVSRPVMVNRLGAEARLITENTLQSPPQSAALRRVNSCSMKNTIRPICET